MSAKRLLSKLPPTSLTKALATRNLDAPTIWDESYGKEYNGLTNLNTFEILIRATYVALPNWPEARPTMCILAAKVDK
jgi:hypothetical protein